jgi:hypothetical protein
MQEGKDELRYGEGCRDEQLANFPVLILGNKIDQPGAAGEDELRYIEVVGTSC